MRRTAALALAASLASGGAGAETWKTYSPGPNGLEWYYDVDYVYRDARTGRVVALQAIGRPGAQPRMGPSGPGKPDGVGSIVALDCRKRTIVIVGSFSPKAPLQSSEAWRDAPAKRVSTPEDKALVAAACAGAANLPVK